MSFAKQEEKGICLKKTAMYEIIEERLKLFVNIINLRDEGIYKLTYVYCLLFHEF